MPEVPNTPLFEDELPDGMQPVEEDPGIQNGNDLPMGPDEGRPAVSSYDAASKALFAAEPISWADVRKMTPAQIDQTLVERGILSEREIGVINGVSAILKDSVKLDEMKINLLAPSDNRAGNLYNLFQIANYKKTNPIVVRFSIGEGLPQLTFPVQIETFRKKDGNVGIDYVTLEAKRPSLYVLDNNGSKLFPPLPLRDNMTDNEKAAMKDARDFEQKYFEMNGTMPRSIKARVWNEEKKTFDYADCLVGRKGADYRLVTVPVDTVRERLEHKPRRTVYSGGAAYSVDLSKEPREALENILHGGGAWVKATPAGGGETKNMFIVYDVAAKNVRMGQSGHSVREAMRAEFSARQDAKKARENKVQNGQKNEQDPSKPRHTLR